jgi:hypothetical protein
MSAAAKKWRASFRHLRESLDGLGAERVEALRAAFPRAQILPAKKKPKSRA